MTFLQRRLCGLGYFAACSFFAIHAANALNGPEPIQIDGGPLGSLELSGLADGYGYYISGTGDTSPSGTKSNGANVGSALVELQKTTGTLQFTLQVGSYGGTNSLGTPMYQTSLNTYTTGPLYAGFLTIAPPSIPGFTISGGQLNSIEGFEGGDWLNSNLLTTEIYYVQTGQSRGVQVTYAHGPVSLNFIFGDGYDTGVFNYVQFLGAYTINSNNIASIYGAANLGTTGPHAYVYADESPVYANSNLLGMYYSYTNGNLNLVPEVQYQYTKARAILGLTKPTSNFGAALFADYSFGKSPYSIGAWGEYVTSHTSQADNFSWFIGPNAEAVGFSVTPTWQYKYLFLRADLGYLYLMHNTDATGVKFGYGGSGTGRNVVSTQLEAGLFF
jgi:hypothetical protein